MKRVIRGMVLLLCGMGAAACGGETSRLKSGEYRSGTAMAGTVLAGTTLLIDLEASTARLGLTDGSHQELTLKAMDEKAWESGCPTQFSSLNLETLEISPSPLTVAGLTLTRPVLTAGCVQGREAVLQGTDPQGVLNQFPYQAR